MTTVWHTMTNIMTNIMTKIMNWWGTKTVFRLCFITDLLLKLLLYVLYLIIMQWITMLIIYRLWFTSYIFFYSLHCPLSGPDLIYISLLIIPCIIYHVTNKETLNLEHLTTCVFFHNHFRMIVLHVVIVSIHLYSFYIHSMCIFYVYIYIYIYKDTYSTYMHTHTQ